MIDRRKEMIHSTSSKLKAFALQKTVLEDEKPMERKYLQITCMMKELYVELYRILTFSNKETILLKNRQKI